jgi:hypothetical protein
VSDLLHFDAEDLIPHEEEFSIGERSFLLREADEAAVVKWRNLQIKSSRMDGTGKIVIGEVADANPFLVSLCLFEKKPDKEGNLQLSKVSKDEITKWPSKVVSKIFDRLMVISDLKAEETEESITKQIGQLSEKLKALRERKETLKNEQGAGTDTSA